MSTSKPKTHPDPSRKYTREVLCQIVRDCEDRIRNPDPNKVCSGFITLAELRAIAELERATTERAIAWLDRQPGE